MIYVIQAGEGLCKIGVARDVWARLGALQTGSSQPLKMLHVFAGGETEERELHQRFASHRISGEWFRPVADIVDGKFGLTPVAGETIPPKLRGILALPHHAAVIAALGGVSKVARALSVHHSRVVRWPAEGIPPVRFPEIRALAESLGITAFNYELLFDGLALSRQEKGGIGLQSDTASIPSFAVAGSVFHDPNVEEPPT